MKLSRLALLSVFALASAPSWAESVVTVYYENMTPGGQAQIGNVDLVKQLNSAAVYRLIDQHGPISRIQIAE
ncbi:hypothetical protein MJM59_28905, partial [Salmonella enterica subsp. enterica serovar Montevideo]|nr:hypothetical protein [Salmonella enterica subsp. enterica serovar Montevideo]